MTEKSRENICQLIPPWPGNQMKLMKEIEMERRGRLNQLRVIAAPRVFRVASEGVDINRRYLESGQHV